MKKFRRVDNGAYFVRSDKLWMICDDCGKMVCVNKRFFGSLHSCLTDEERGDKLIKEIKNEKTKN